MLIKLLKQVRFCRLTANWLTQQGWRWELIKWERNGRPIPPPHMVKQRLLRRMARKSRLKILVETGTYHGDMVEALKIDFDRIYSIELSRELCARARERFHLDRHVSILHGDSAKELGAVLKLVDEPALFWLDGHYSSGATARGEKETPVFEELAQIFDKMSRGHVIVIDDARNFGTSADYPGLHELMVFVKERQPLAVIDVEADCIIITLSTGADRRDG